jgi:hypothetical protein
MPESLPGFRNRGAAKVTADTPARELRSAAHAEVVEAPKTGATAV